MGQRFGEVLKRTRNREKKTLREVALRAGISIGYLSDIERGRRKPPSLSVVQKIEGFLNIGNRSLTNLAKREIESFIIRDNVKTNMNHKKYKPFPTIHLPDRQWPNMVITKAPIWCSVDLRDGNQALSIPMGVEKKLELFDLLVKIGFKEIEVGFPASSDIEFDFMRILIEENRIPDDVTVQVLTQSRSHLIKKTFESLEGVKKAIVHLYNSTSALQRRVVFRKNKEEIKSIAVEGAKLIKKLKKKAKNPGIRFQYSPESFTETELDYAVEICHAVMDVWEPTPSERIILNLPATVEAATPNVHADQIEWFCRRIKNRKSVIISLHAHNDRGTSVAATELALMAGADRVEGTLFGNGERTGNVDIVTMALNMFSQGIDCKLNFCDINLIREIYSRCTLMDVHKRHPYAGELVYTAFSGSHQDAISKGMAEYRSSKTTIWGVPYLPIDPRDVGRNYESIVRINSQSGKGGVAYVLDQEFGFKLPRAMQSEFASVIQTLTDSSGDEAPPSVIWDSFEREYLSPKNPSYELKTCHIQVDVNEGDKSNEGKTRVDTIISINGNEVSFEGMGNGPIDAFVCGLKQQAGIDFTIENYDEHAIGKGSDSRAAAYISITDKDGRSVFGVGVDSNISIASIKAILSALNRRR